MLRLGDALLAFRVVYVITLTFGIDFHNAHA